MARLNELKTVDFVKVLVYGEPGGGKTVFSTGFPGPILYFDFDNKVSSAARFYRNDLERLKQIEVVQLGSTLHESPINELQKRVNELARMQKAGEYPYKTLVIDSITTFSSACLSHIVQTNPGIKRVITAQGQQPGMQDFGILKREFQRLIPGLLTLEMNVVMLGHISITKDEFSGELIRGVLMDGSFAEQLPIYFEEVYRAYVTEVQGGKREFFAQTQSDGKFKCRSQIPGLPSVIPLKYEELSKLR
jgi:hypothetical protein